MQAISNIMRFVLCLLIQMVLFNRLWLFGVGHPYIYILCLIALPLRLPRWAEMLVGAATGLVMDTICSSPGVHMAACALIAYIRPALITSLVQEPERVVQDISSAIIGRTEFLKVVVLLTVIHHTAVFMLDAWSFNAWWLTLLRVIFSSAMTIFLLLAYDRLSHA